LDAPAAFLSLPKIAFFALGKGRIWILYPFVLC